ncbi:hypothetical protein DMC15_00630 [Vibrio sp. 11986-1-5]|nr:hypothetical protein DMC15_00630 [Vibrio sp. 11986-1-5]
MFKKNSNSWFSGIYSKKLLTLYSHIRIMRTVRSEKATSKLRNLKLTVSDKQFSNWLRSSAG